MEIDTIVCGDCLSVMADMPDGCVDLVLADLPYGTTACKWDVIIPFDLLWKQYKRITKKDAAIALTASQPFTSLLVMSNLEMFKYEWIWQKNRGSNFASVKYQPMKEHESILIFGKGRTRYYPIKEQRQGGGLNRVQYKFIPSNTGKRQVYGGLKEKGKRKRMLMRVPSSIQKFNTEVGLHPTQKPIKLFEYLISTYSLPGDLVFDNVMGSGTTAVAALKLGRHFYGCDISPEYVKLANERIEKARLEMAQMELFQ